MGKDITKDLKLQRKTLFMQCETKDRVKLLAAHLVYHMLDQKDPIYVNKKTKLVFSYSARSKSRRLEATLAGEQAAPTENIGSTILTITSPESAAAVLEGVASEWRSGEITQSYRDALFALVAIFVLFITVLVLL